jgi:hypothetical protein
MLNRIAITESFGSSDHVRSFFEKLVSSRLKELEEVITRSWKWSAGLMAASMQTYS